MYRRLNKSFSLVDSTVAGTVSSLDMNQKCLYKNKTYTRGQTWMDGCDYKCTCERNGIAQCSPP